MVFVDSLLFDKYTKENLIKIDANLRIKKMPKQFLNETSSTCITKNRFYKNDYRNYK